jgi:1-deoxy-D-xylulose-5-phosphate synthase
MASEKSVLALRKLSDAQLKVLASDIRSDILTSVLINGGHLSSNLGAVELTMGLLKEFDPVADDILFDVGHQTYSYKILTGRNLSHLRRTGGIAPFSLRSESPADKYDSGHAGDAISIAYGMAKAKVLAGDRSATIALTGDSSVVNGLSMEALNLLSTDHSTPLIIVVNDNEMSISRNVGFMGRKFQKLRNSRFYFRMSFGLGQNMAKHRFTWRMFLGLRNLKDKFKGFLLDPTVFEAMGLHYIGPFDGHDFESLDLAFRKARAMAKTGPVVVHVLTKKGYGYPPAMADECGKFHGVKPAFDVEEEEPDPSESFVGLKTQFLLKAMKEDPKLFVITPAMEIGSGLGPVFKEFPTRCLDVGIAEENAVSMASGLALKGYHPFIDIYSSFLQRAYDEIFEDVAREKIPVVFGVERAGLVGEDGASHHGLYDVAMVRSIPHSRVLMPYDAASLNHILSQPYFEGKEPVFVRFPKDSPFTTGTKPLRQLPGADILSQESTGILALSVGPLGAEFLSDLPGNPARILLLDLLPSDAVLEPLNLLSYSRIFFYDAYGTQEGTASLLANYLFRKGFAGVFESHAFPTEFVTFGQRSDLLQENGLDIASLRQNFLDFEKKPS